MITCTRRIQFCAGHRVHGHENKCRNLHGHNYVAYFTVEATELDQIGRVIDFSCIKERLGRWIDENWDHGFIYWAEDLEVRNVLSNIETKFYAMPTNPTAENMADYLLRSIGPMQLSGTNCSLVKVQLWETENCVAEASFG